MNQFREGTPCIRDSVEDVLLKTKNCAEQHFSRSKVRVWCARSLIPETETVWLWEERLAVKKTSDITNVGLH